MQAKVLVTGANGHLGNTLVRELCERGYRVRATVRNPAEAESSGIFDGLAVSLYQADIRHPEDMEAAMTGVDGVFQVAALYHFDERKLGEGIVENNRDGSVNVLRLAKAAGVKRVVMTSSIAAIGFGGTQAEPMTEESWSNPSNPYFLSKVLSEKAAWEFAEANGLDLITICPSMVLGPNFYKHTASTINVSAYVNNQVPFQIPFQPSVVDVRDVALAHILAFENKEARGRYLVTGHHVPDFVSKLKEVDPDMLVPARKLSMDEARQFARKSGSPVEMVGQTFLYSDRKARTELGWQPRPAETTLRDTVAWIKAKNL
jgi:dihydroflavonol-4-reductase